MKEKKKGTANLGIHIGGLQSKVVDFNSVAVDYVRSTRKE